MGEGGWGGERGVMSRGFEGVFRFTIKVEVFTTDSGILLKFGIKKGIQM